MEETKSDRETVVSDSSKEQVAEQSSAQQIAEVQPVVSSEGAEKKEKSESFEKEKLAEIFGRIERNEKKLNEIEAKIEKITETINNLKDTIGSATDYANKILDTAFRDKFSNTAREIEKLNEKLAMVMDEVGVGEGLNVAKIPPTILEIVYQSTLDDVVNAIFKHLGYTEAERKIAEVLEEVRERTSGSELFRFDGKRIRTRDVALSIEKKLVSAKQMQTTYDELLKKLLDLVPGYKPKNFRALIKLKSQEYSVDATIRLAERVSTLEKWTGKIENLINQYDVREASVLELLNQLKERVEMLHTKIDDTNLKVSSLEAEVESYRGETKAELVGILERIKVIEERLGIAKAVEEPERKVEVSEEKEEVEIGEDESFLYYAVENERALRDVKNTLSLMFSDEKIEGLIENLVKKGFIEKFEKDGEVYLRRVMKEVPKEQSLEDQILQTMEDGFTFRKLQHKFKGVDKGALQAAIEKLIDEGKIYVEGTERRKIYRISCQALEEKKDGGG